MSCVAYSSQCEACQGCNQEIKTCNWLYKHVHERCIDESTKQIIEVTNNATTEMLKVTPNDVDTFQAYTIRNLDNKLSVGSDIEQYKLTSITEDPLVQTTAFGCDVFPCTLSYWVFGEFHPRKERISPGEYIKSRLLNKDSRFRKDPQYVFCGKRKWEDFWCVHVTEH